MSRIQGKNSESSRNPPPLWKDPHLKQLRIQVFGRAAQMNSLRDRTGKQFDQNRERNSRQQGINSAQQGIQRDTDPLADFARLRRVRV
jgi:hypothetical protein